jgi:anti-sigma B factor antagonist
MHLMSDLTIDQRTKEGITILDLHGRLVIGQSEMALRESARALISSRITEVILNFLDVRELDNDGIAALKLCESLFRGAGGAMRLANLHNVHLSASLLTELYASFEVFEDEQESINSFFPNRAIQRIDILRLVEEINKKDAG